MTPLLWLGAAGSWLFPIVFLLDGLTRPGYHPARHPVSALALGPRGWLQSTNFIVSGLLITAGAIALPQALDHLVLPLAVAALGLALVTSGVFRMDPMRGYPPGTPDEDPKHFSLTHRLHDWAGMVVFLLLPFTPLIAVFTLGSSAWMWGSGITAAATAVCSGAFGQLWEKDSPYTGVVQRATIILGLTWLGALFLHGAA